MTEAEEIAVRRAALRQRYGAAYDQLSAILFEEDPVGINFGNNSDEYEPEVDTILPRLRACRTVIDIRDVVHAEFVHWFGLDDIGDAEAYRRVAERIWSELSDVLGPRLGPA